METSTLECDVFSLGCCFAWIHSVVSSKLWEKGEEDDQGPSQLEELVSVGFANTTREISSLLKRLRRDPKSPKNPETLIFLKTMEQMIEQMWIPTTRTRVKLEILIEQLKMLEARCRLYQRRKTIHLCVTSGRTTKVNEIDVSNVSTDTEFFKLIRERMLSSRSSMMFDYSSLKISLGTDDVRFIKFRVYDGVFGVLEGPSAVPSSSILQAGEYECDSSSLTEVPVPSSVFILELLDSSVSSQSLWFDRIPKRLHVVDHRGSSSSGITSQLPDENTIPNDVQWGIQIVRDTSGF